MSSPTWGMAVPEPDWRCATLLDAKLWAAEFSAYDPDQYHPQYVMDLLRAPWPDDRQTPARTLPSVEAMALEFCKLLDRHPRPAPAVVAPREDADEMVLFAAPVVQVPRAPAPDPVHAPKPERVATLELDLFSATPLGPEPTPEEALDLAMESLAAAHAAKGELPTLDDCHRRRFGLPGVEAFQRAGGWHACVVRLRARGVA